MWQLTCDVTLHVALLCDEGVRAVRKIHLHVCVGIPDLASCQGRLRIHVVDDAFPFQCALRCQLVCADIDFATVLAAAHDVQSTVIRSGD
eukprot:9417077-Karenia_brevis.AAC.1